MRLGYNGGVPIFSITIKSNVIATANINELASLLVLEVL